MTSPPVTKKAAEHCAARNTLSGRVGNRPCGARGAATWTKNTISGVTEQITTLATRQPPTNTMVAGLEPILVSSQPENSPARAATTLLISPSAISMVGVQCRMPAANTPVNSIMTMKPSLKNIRESR